MLKKLLFSERYKESLPTIILRILQNAGPNEGLHGYVILKKVEAVDDTLRIGIATIYPLLHDLEDAGQIAGEWEVTASGKPRKLYKITDDGSKRLAREGVGLGEFLVRAGKFVLGE